MLTIEEWVCKRTANSANRLFVLLPAGGVDPVLASGAFTATFLSFAPTFRDLCDGIVRCYKFYLKNDGNSPSTSNKH